MDVFSQYCKFWRNLSFKTQLLLRTLLYLALGLFTIFSNPFGLNDYLQIQTQQVVSKVMAPWFPYGESNKKDKVVVVLINDRSLETLDSIPSEQKIIVANEWPILYKDHANIIKAIAAHSNPKQIFIDIEFHKIRNTDSSFPYLIHTLKKINQKKEIQFLHAIGSIARPISSDVNKYLSEFSSPVKNAWSSNYMPLISYVNQNDYVLSPALQMYQNLNPSINLSKFEKEMFVFWRSSPNKAYFEHTPEVCFESSETPLSSSIELLVKGILSIESREACYPQKVVYLDELQRMLSQGTIGKQKIHDIFTNATILYGTEYIALSDRINSPTHASIPGVFYHAMALENLLEFKEEYFRNNDNKWLDIVFWCALSILLIISTIISRTMKAPLHPRSRNTIISISLILVLILSYFIILTFFLIYMRLAPANVLALLGLIGFALYLSMKEKGCQNSNH